MYAKNFLLFLSVSFQIGVEISIFKEINIFLDVPYTVEGRAGKTARLTGSIRILSEGKGGRTDGRTYACFQQAEADRVVSGRQRRAEDGAQKTRQVTLAHLKSGAEPANIVDVVTALGTLQDDPFTVIREVVEHEISA